jgi:hypothetical protein
MARPKDTTTLDDFPRIDINEWNFQTIFANDDLEEALFYEYGRTIPQVVEFTKVVQKLGLDSLHTRERTYFNSAKDFSPRKRMLFEANESLLFEYRKTAFRICSGISNFETRPWCTISKAERVQAINETRFQPEYEKKKKDFDRLDIRNQYLANPLDYKIPTWAYSDTDLVEHFSRWLQYNRTIGPFPDTKGMYRSTQHYLKILGIYRLMKHYNNKVRLVRECKALAGKTLPYDDPGTIRSVYREAVKIIQNPIANF